MITGTLSCLGLPDGTHTWRAASSGPPLRLVPGLRRQRGTYLRQIMFHEADGFEEVEVKPSLPDSVVVALSADQALSAVEGVRAGSRLMVAATPHPPLHIHVTARIFLIPSSSTDTICL
ncbi:hypothetical protein Tco_1135548 [Tanacetum coccineum]